MPTHSFKIRAGLSPSESTIELDGKELDGVVRVCFELSADNVTTLKLDIIGEVLVEGEFRESAILQVSQAAIPNG